MSTLNMPAIIARLHGSEQFGKHEQSQQQDVSATSLKDSFWKQPMYLDQVLRKHNGDQNFFTRQKSGNKLGQQRRRYPRFLPKLDEKPINNTVTAAPFVKGRNVEHFSGDNSSFVHHPTSYHTDDDDDDDAVWARNALNSTTSKDIAKSYDEIILSLSKTESEYGGSNEVKVKQVETSSDGKQKQAHFSKMDLLPPIGRKGDLDTAAEVRTEKHGQSQGTTTLVDNRQKKLKVSFLSFDCRNEFWKKLFVSKVNARPSFAQTSEQKSTLQSTSTEIGKNKSHNNEQSTFSRIMHPDSSPKTHAGRKLLTSLLKRPGNEKQPKQKRAIAIPKKPGAILYSEDYLRVVDSLEHETNKLQPGKNIPNKSYGTGEPVDKLPAEMVGHHFQHTYENLWKYLMTNGGKQNVRPFFPSKRDLQNGNPDVIYIPTGRPEEALSVARVGNLQNGLEDNSTNPVKLKYIHRNGDEDPTDMRTKDTSPWDIDQQLRTPVSSTKRELSPELRETLVHYDSSSNASALISDGIRKLSITLPIPEIRAPPCTPIIGKEQVCLTDQTACSVDCGYCKPDHPNTFSEIHDNPENNSQTKAQYYPTPVKVINFKKDVPNQKPKEKAKKHIKPNGPVPASKQEAIADTTSESKKSDSKKTRYYSHGQYLVKVEESLIKKRKIKLPRDMNNMFTKPYTFSYLTGVQAPCNLSQKLEVYSGKIANLSKKRVTNTDKTVTSLVTSIRKKEEHLTGSVEKQDASTQFEEQDAVDLSTDLSALRAVSPSIGNQHQFRVSPQPSPKTTNISTLVPPDDEDNKTRNESFSPSRSPELRPLSEGAKDIDIRKYRDKVKTYDASKYFRSAGLSDKLKN